MIPTSLKKGDEVRVIAPSGSLSRLSKENFDIAKNRFFQLGLNLTISENAFIINQYGSSSIEQRIHDLEESFKDKNVKMIICAIGGYNCNEILDYINYDIIKSNPKIIIGYSDITALLNAITSRTGLVTYYGPNFTDFAIKKGFDYTLDYFSKILVDNGLIKIEASSEFSDDKWYIDQENRTFLSNEGHIVVNSCNQDLIEGKIIAGNLSTLQLLQGTIYMPDLTDKILFLEDDDLVGENFLFEFSRNLESLLCQKGGDKIKSIIIGRNQLKTKLSNNDFSEMLKKKEKLKNIPIIINVDFGHTKPLITIPIGGYCKIAKDNIYIVNEKIIN